MVETNKPKRRNNVNKRLDGAAIRKREREAEKRNIPRLKDLSLAINQRLLDLGKNQEWLVDETGIGKATISAYYNAESMPNGVNLIKLAEKLQTTPDYLLGFANTPTTDFDIRAICEKTGLSDKAVGKIINMKSSSPHQLHELNALIERFDFTDRLLGGIVWLKVDAINKNLFEKGFMENNPNWNGVQTEEPIDDKFKFYSERLMGKWISVNPLTFYLYSKNELTKNFEKLIEDIINKYLETVDFDAELANREHLIGIVKGKTNE